MRCVAGGVSEEGDEVEGRGVGPVEILEHEEKRGRGTQPLEDGERLLEQPELRVGGVSLDRGRRSVRRASSGTRRDSSRSPPGTPASAAEWRSGRSASTSGR